MKTFFCLCLNTFSYVLEDGDQIQAYKELISSNSGHKCSPEIIWYHQSRDALLRAYVSGKSLADIFSVRLFAVGRFIGDLWSL